MKIKTPAVWIVMFAAAFGVGAVMVYVRTTPPLVPHRDSVELKPEAPKRFVPEERPHIKQAQMVSIYIPKMGPDGISFTKQDELVPDGADAKVFALNTFLKESEIAPDDAKVLGVDLREDGLARIDCNPAFNQTYGSFDEKKMLDGLASVMGQFPEVKTWVLEVDNEPLKTLGNADLTEPIPVIRPADVPMVPTFSKPPVETYAPPAKP